MKTNKSIDGLSYGDAKKSTSQVSATTKITKSQSTIIKPKAQKSAPKSTTKKIALSVKTPKSSAASNQPVKTRSHEQTVEDFLKPIQAFDFDSTTGELTASNKPNHQKESSISEPKAKQSKKDGVKKPSKARRIISIIALVIVLGLIGLVSWAVFWGNDIIAKITGGQGNVLDLIKFVEPTYDPLKTDDNGRTNILAFGTSGYDMSGDEGNGVHAGAQLTDSIMMISLNQETGDVAMLSLPRDLKASPTCTATGKINEVYWCNGGGYDISTEEEAEAATALMTEVGSILGVDFQYYAHLNWGSLITIVDILDGIEVTLDEDINDAWWTGAVYEAGVTYTLNGEEALGLARARHGTVGGDFSRGASQQKILIGIKDKFLSRKDLSIFDFINLASTLGDNFRSNFSIEELKTAAHVAIELNFDNMRQISLWPDYMTTGTLDNGISYVFPRAGVSNYGVIQEYVAEQISNDPRVYEYPTIAVLNATDEVGLASAEASKLEEAGYHINTTDNAPEGTTFTDDITIYYSGDKPGTKAMLEKQYQGIKFKSISEAPESISRDYSFIIVLGPTPSSEESQSQKQQ